MYTSRGTWLVPFPLCFLVGVLMSWFRNGFRAFDTETTGVEVESSRIVSFR